MPKVLLTGGGTAGHATPNLALLPYLKEKGFEIEYMGSYDGIEKGLAENAGLKYIGIDSGKLRRYLSAQNLIDPIHILHGTREASEYIKKSKPDVVFSKGGFVAVPVVYAAHHNKVPVIIHESDYSPGLANKMCLKQADKICYSFPETAKYLEKDSAIYTGLPIREELINGDAEKGRKMCGFNQDKPIMMIIGGSLGSVNVNNAIRGALDELLQKFQVVHLCGKGKMDESYNGREGYVQYEYIIDELKDLMAMSSIIVSRSGANAVFEIAAIAKPAILIPLGAEASRGDQILNARSFEKQGFSAVLLEENMTKESLLEKVKDTYENREKYINAMKSAKIEGAAKRIADLIEETAKRK